MTNKEAIKFAKTILMVAENAAVKGEDLESHLHTIDFTKTALEALEAQEDPETIVTQWTEANGYTLIANDLWRDAKKAFEKHNDWITCADDLPKKHDMYLVTWTGHLGSLKPEKWLDMLEFFPDEDGKEGEGWAVYDLEKQGFKDIHVLAWQDLPEVY